MIKTTTLFQTQDRTCSQMKRKIICRKLCNLGIISIPCMFEKIFKMGWAVILGYHFWIHLIFGWAFLIDLFDDGVDGMLFLLKCGSEEIHGILSLYKM